MRKLLIFGGLATCLVLAACEKAEEAPAAPAAPVVKKSLARRASTYAGQEQIQSVASGKAEVDGTGLKLQAEGQPPGPGYTGAFFLPRIYAAAPKDGIYEVDVIANAPATPGAKTPTPITVKGVWPNYPAGRLKGVRFMTATNDVVAMLPEAK